MEVRVVEPDPRWPELFSVEAERVKKILGSELVAIHHIGSTAVENLAAKPIIDIMPVVKDIEKVDASVKGLLPRLRLWASMSPRCRYFRKETWLEPIMFTFCGRNRHDMNHLAYEITVLIRCSCRIRRVEAESRELFLMTLTLIWTARIPC